MKLVSRLARLLSQAPSFIQIPSDRTTGSAIDDLYFFCHRTNKTDCYGFTEDSLYIKAGSEHFSHCKSLSSYCLSDASVQTLLEYGKTAESTQ